MSFPQPDINALNEPYWTGLKQGVLKHQHCAACDHNWLPAREACPRCLAPEPVWQVSSGQGRIVSWVIYHVAYDDAFKDRLPYNVACVVLDEGPRILTNIINCDVHRDLAIDRPVSLCIEHEGDLAIARFSLQKSAGSST